MVQHIFAGLRCTRLLACAAIIGSAGCTSPAGDLSAGAMSPTTSNTRLTQTKDLVLPLDRYLFSLRDYRVLSEAHGILVRRCMQRMGVDYRSAGRLQGSRVQTRNQRRYGVTDPAEARRYGYRAPGRSDKPAPKTAQDRDPKILALLGGGQVTSSSGSPVPSGGCIGEAQRILKGRRPSGVAAQDIAEPMAVTSWHRSAADHRVREVFARWAECMKRAGFKYQTPLEPSRDQRLMRGLSPLQIRTATADASCKQKHNVVGVWAAVETTHQEAMVRENKHALELLRTANMAELQVASTVVPAR